MQYQPEHVMFRPILQPEEKHCLHSLARQYSLHDFKKDVRNYEEMTTDFVYTSARMEGNTYDRIDTDNLLRAGITAGGKRYSDAVMLLNLRSGFEQVMAVDDQTVFDIAYLCDLHKVVMKDLLPVNEQGCMRITGVRIGASNYHPLNNPERLQTELKFMISEAEKYSDPFEQAIYFHCNLAYLQYFRDGNKRTARLMQTAVLTKNDILPLFFKDTLIDKYQRAVVDYYETGRYDLYVDFFKENYQQVMTEFMRSDEQPVLHCLGKRIVPLQP